MATLNEDVNFPSWANGTFKGTPAKVLIGKGTRLYKFTSKPILDKESARITPWWSSVEATPAGDWGLENLSNMAKHLGVSEAELVRVTSAISDQWKGETSANEITQIVKITLAENIYGWHGPAAEQKKNQANQSTKNYPGCNLQYFTPFMKPWHISNVETLKAK